MATPRDIERRLEELIARAGDGDAPLDASLRRSRRVLALRLTDHDAHYWSELSDGRMGRLERGEPERADIRVHATSDDLIEVLEGRTSLMSAWLGGKVRVDASPTDLFKLRGLLG